MLSTNVNGCRVQVPSHSGWDEPQCAGRMDRNSQPPSRRHVSSDSCTRLVELATGSLLSETLLSPCSMQLPGQCLSSITEFSDLVSTIQTSKHLNPLQVSCCIPGRVWALTRGIAEQMRRAVKDYKYEVHEGRMTEECSQYLAQLQKDWERHRVKLGVEALRKEVASSTTTKMQS
jgi:hypothetical protein